MIPFDVWLEIDSGIGRATPPRRAPSPGMHTLNRHMPSPSGPGSLPPGLITKRRGMDDGSSDMSSTGNLMMDYSGSYAKFSNLYHQIYYFIIYKKIESYPLLDYVVITYYYIFFCIVFLFFVLYIFYFNHQRLGISIVIGYYIHPKRDEFISGFL